MYKVEGLVKRYGDLTAVAGVSFEVRAMVLLGFGVVFSVTGARFMLRPES